MQNRMQLCLDTFQLGLQGPCTVIQWVRDWLPVFLGCRGFLGCANTVGQMGLAATTTPTKLRLSNCGISPQYFFIVVKGT